MTKEEIQAYIGILIYMSIYNLPDVKTYFYDEMISCNIVKNCMTYNRYIKISQYFHVEHVDRVQEETDFLHKVRLMLDVAKRFKEVFQPGCEISVDEAMIGYKGRLSFKQYMPMKPTKWGIKVWVAAESKSGYILDMDVYTGKKETRNNNFLLGEQVVLNLAEPFFGNFHHFFFDNFFSSVRLVDILAENETYACGTIRCNRQDLPEEFKDLKSMK